MEKFKSFILSINLVGINPQMLIFNDTKYKSLFSSILSIIIILVSILFSIFSLIEYLKYNSPNIGFSKDNDENTMREFKNLRIMFQLVDSANIINTNIINESIAYYQVFYIANYVNGTTIYIPLDIENCEFGKHIDMSFKEIISNNKSFGRTLEDFYCINNKDNLSLFYNQNFGYSIINLQAYYNNNSIYTPENIYSLIITENDIIDHYNKSNPIKQGFTFQFTPSYSSLEYMKNNYNYQYIKYESDEGLFYKHSYFYDGLSFSDMTFNRYYKESNIVIKNTNYSYIGSIDFSINKSNFDSYKRNYQRLQSLLAEVMSVVNLLFGIGGQISYFLDNKKMNQDIFETLFYESKDKNNIYINHNHNHNINDNMNINNDMNIHNISLNKRNKRINKDKVNSNSDSPYIDKNDEMKINSINDSNNTFKNEKNDKNNKNNNNKDNIKIKEEINYYHIIKSYLCFKDKKTNFINHCYEYINKDLSIENLLKRFYNIENNCYRPKMNDKMKRQKNLDNLETQFNGQKEEYNNKINIKELKFKKENILDYKT